MTLHDLLKILCMQKFQNMPNMFPFVKLRNAATDLAITKYILKYISLVTLLQNKKNNEFNCKVSFDFRHQVEVLSCEQGTSDV